MQNNVSCVLRGDAKLLQSIIGRYQALKMQYMDLLLAISTFLLMIFTGLYVFFTYRLQKETKRSVDEINRPEILVDLYVSKMQPGGSGNPIIYELSLSVTNVGTRAAHNIRLSCDKSFIPAFGSPLMKHKFFKNGIDVLTAQKAVRDVLQSTQNISEIFDNAYYEHRNSKIKVKVEYQSVNGTEYPGERTLDFNNRDEHRL